MLSGWATEWARPARFKLQQLTVKGTGLCWVHKANESKHGRNHILSHTLKKQNYDGPQLVWTETRFLWCSGFTCIPLNVKLNYNQVQFVSLKFHFDRSREPQPSLLGFLLFKGAKVCLHSVLLTRTHSVYPSAYHYYFIIINIKNVLCVMCYTDFIICRIWYEI